MIKKKNDGANYTPPTPLVIDNEAMGRYREQLGHYFDSLLLRPYSTFNGGILIAKGGTILYEQYRGFEDLPEKSMPITAASALHIASTTKTFTGIAVLQLVQQGKLSLQDTITRFFPALPYSGITIQDLLSHRSGLPNYLYFMETAAWDKSKMAQNSDVLQVMINERPARHAPPNKRFEYCNTNYVLLALLIEKITGKTYPDYLQTQFFDRLGMKNSYVYTQARADQAIGSYQPNGASWPMDYLDLTYGDKNIYSTPIDLLKWDQALYTYQLLDSALLQKAFTAYSFERPGTHHYGLGFRLQLLPSGKKIIYHFGRWHGSNAAFARLPQEQVTIIILGNRFNRSIYSAAHNCYDLFGNYFGESDKEEE